MNSTMSSVLRFSGRRLVHTSNSLPAVGVDQALRSSQAAQEQQSIDGHLTKGKDSDNGLKSAALKNVREIKGVQEEDPLVVQKSLGARADQITAALIELKPRLAALKDPEARKEVELHVRDLARRGHLISEAKRKLDAILRERGESW